MISLTLTAHLAQPAAINHPPMLDALLYVGLHIRLTAMDPERWPGPHPLPAVFELPLPLARVEHGGLWWWACSQATPEGPEAVRHEHRRPASDVYQERQQPDKRGRLGKVNIQAGPDKALRIPVFTRPGWMAPRWTCVTGDASPAMKALGLPADTNPVTLILHLLSAVPSIGARTNRGHGAIDRWDVAASGPPLDAYANDLSLRHLPLLAAGDLPAGARVARTSLPLRAPYYGPERVECFQVRP